MTKKEKSNKQKNMQKNLAVAIALISSINNVTPLTMASAADGFLNAPLKEQLGREMAASFNRGGQVLNCLFFTTAYAEEINKGKIKDVEPANDNSPAYGDVINSGGTQNVNKGGIARDTTINSGGTQHVNSGGNASNTAINGDMPKRNPGIQNVYDGGNASDTTINSGGWQHVWNGGSTYNTYIYSNGWQDINDGGTATSTTINGGEQRVNSDGSAIVTTINSGGWQILSGNSGSATATGTIINSGSQYVNSGGSAIDTTINSDGWQVIYGDGNASDTTINSGGLQQVDSGGKATITTINGGEQSVRSGGKAIITTISGGWQDVNDGGIAAITTINSGGTQQVMSGGSTFGTTIDGGVQLLSASSGGGSAIVTIIKNGGMQEIHSGGSASGTIIDSGGKQYIFNSGSASDAKINSGGWQVIYSDGNASDTTINSGGTQQVMSGGSAIGTTINGGVQLLSAFSGGGSAIVTIIKNGGMQEIHSGGSASGTIIDSGGKQYMYNSGSASDTKINSGGYLGIYTGAGNLSGQNELNQGTIQLFGDSGDTFMINELEITGGGCINLTGNSADDIIYGNASDKAVGRYLTIDTLTGSADFIINTDLTNTQADYINIKSGTANHTMQIAYDPIFENDGSVNDVRVPFATVENGTTFAAAATDYGAYHFIPTLEADPDGTVWSIIGLNMAGGSETLYTAIDTAANSLMLWRQENDALIRRMGELRHGTSKTGDWVRIYKGEQKADLDGRRITQHYTAIQGGYDKAFNWGGQNWRAGYMVGYLDADADYNRGSGDASSFSVGGYATWLGDKGHYLDLVIKQGRLKNSYDSYLNSSDATKVSGSYHNWGTSLSAEYGYRKSLKDGWYVEPQSQFTLGRVTSADYTASDGTSVRHNGITSSVGRLGVSVGRTVGESNFYVTTSWAREFNASPRVSMSSGDKSEVAMEHSLKESWLEMAVGVTGQLGGNKSGYMEISRTTGGKVKTPWQANAGVRWNF